MSAGVVVVGDRVEPSAGPATPGRRGGRGRRHGRRCAAERDRLSRSVHYMTTTREESSAVLSVSLERADPNSMA